MSDLIDRQELLRQIDIDADGEPGYYGDTWKFIDTIKSMPSATDTNVGTKLGTNLAEVGTDCISRQAAIDAVNSLTYPSSLMDVKRKLIELPPAQPESHTDALKAEIKRMKRSFTICINSDYYTGYMSALSAVEGYIAQMEVTE